MSDIPFIIPGDDEVTLDAYIGRGLQPGEEALPDEAAGELCSFGVSASADSSWLIVVVQPTFNEELVSQLESMGFPTIRCQKALLATGNSNAEAAMEWLFAHMEDPGIVDLTS